MGLSQKRKQLRLYPEVLSTDVCKDTRSEELIASYVSESPTGQVRLMESILERNNMRRAVSV
ncbi:MAG: hypothetical protein J7K15_03890 [Deltaproteobacteria bacterium]|nr:hypothetical protein [Deltaproteobacteria bacterium]